MGYAPMLTLAVHKTMPVLPGGRLRRPIICGLVLACGLAARAHAADFTYSGGTSGTWDTTATGWTGASGTPWDSTNGPGNTATFSAGTPVNVSVNVYTNGITFSAITTTLQSTGVVNFAGTNPTVTANTQGNLFSSIAGSFTKNGTAELYIGGDNSTTLANATVTLAAGRTRAYQPTPITGKELGPVSTTVDIQSGARLRWFQKQNDAATAYTATARIAGTGSMDGGAFNNDGNATANRVFWDGPVILAADATIIGQNSGTYTFGGAFTEEVPSTLTFSLNAGTSNVNAGLAVSGLRKIGNGGLAFGPAATVSVGTLTMGSGTGTVSFDPATSVAVANWALNGGTVAVARTGIINAGNTITFGGGTLAQTGSDVTDYSGLFATSAAQTFRINTGSNAITWVSNLVSTGGSIVKTGSGTLTLSGDNTGLGGAGTALSFGGTNVNGGYVAPSSANAFGSLARIALQGQNAGVSGIKLAGGLSFSTPIETLGRDNPTTVGSILENVSGDNAWNGPITITGGGGEYGLVSTAGTLTIGGNLTSTVTGLGTPRTVRVAGAGDTVISGQIVKGGTAALSQDLGITKSGSGTLTLSGTNDFDGPTTVSAGRILFNGDSSLATGGISVNGGTLGGTGSVGGAVSVNSGGRLAPGLGIDSFATGAASLVDGSFFDYKIDSTAAASIGADLLVVNGNFDLAGTVALSLADLAGSPVAVTPGTTFTLANYSGSWNTGIFSFSGTPLADGDTFTAGLNTWQIDYAAASGGVNFPGEHVAGGFINLTAVPEPAGLAVALAAAGMLTAAIRAARGRGSKNRRS